MSLPRLPVAEPEDVIEACGRPSGAWRLLVCEGICNPGLARLDAAVRRSRGQAAGLGEKVVLIGPGETREGLRRLRHTRHRGLGATLWVCETCGTIRHG